MAFNLICWLSHALVDELGGLLLISSPKSALADEPGYTLALVPTQLPLGQLLLPLRLAEFKAWLERGRVSTTKEAYNPRRVPGKEAVSEFHITLEILHGITRSMHSLDDFSMLLPLPSPYAG